MVRTLIAGTAVAGALTFGAAGLAGAASTPHGTGNGSGVASASLCSRLPKIEAKVARIERRVEHRVPKAEAREAKAKGAGHTKKANAIAARLARVQTREGKVNARLAKAKASLRVGRLGHNDDGFDINAGLDTDDGFHADDHAWYLVVHVHVHVHIHDHDDGW